LAKIIPNAFMQDLPNQTTQPVGDCADRLGVSESGDEPATDDREDHAFGFDRSVRRLIEDAPHLAVAFGAVVQAIIRARGATVVR
jgi:hypothetical protein